MDGRNPRDEWMLKLDLLERLVELGCTVDENPVTRSEVKGWFQPLERDLADDLMDDLLSNPNAPVETPSSDSGAIGITDYDEANAFIQYLYDNPSWFDG